MTQPPQYPGTPDPSDDPAGGQGGGTPPPVPPQQPSYGAPQPQQPPPAYGAPPPQQPSPYGASPYGGASAYPGGPGGPGGQQEAGKGMAITALVLSFLSCTVVAGLVSIVLAALVLIRGKDGRDHGKGFAITALVLSALGILGAILVGTLLAVGVASMKDVDDLNTGDCISAKGLTDSGSDTVEEVQDKSCSEEHDGEVVLSKELTSEEADAYTDNQTSVCADAISTDPTLLQKMSSVEGLTVIALTEELPPEAGDTVACVAYRQDGGTLTEKLG